MKSKKWPLAHVWSHIITLKHPKLTPFVSARRYDHEEVPEHMSVFDASIKFYYHKRDAMAIFCVLSAIFSILR